MATGVRNSDHPSAVVDFQTLCDKFINFESVNKDVFQTFAIEGKFCNYETMVGEVQAKEEKRRMDVDVVGPTSSGKSLIVNNLIRMDVMRSGPGHTTPSAVVIDVTHENEAYYYVGNKSKRKTVNLSSPEGQREFHRLVDNVSRNPRENARTSIKLFLPKDEVKGTILTSDVVLLDSPGTDLDVFQTEDIQNEVKEVDVRVLVIDIVIGLNRKTAWEALSKCQNVVRPNVLVVFNKCDEFDEDKDYERVHESIKSQLLGIIDFLTRDKKYYQTEEEARKAVFFISAKEVRQERKRSQQISSSKDSPGYDTDNGFYNFTRESRLAGFRSFERSLILLAKSQREQMKKQRIMRAAQQYKGELINEARGVGEKLNDVKENLCTLLASYGFDSTKRYRQFVEKFSSCEIRIEGSTKVERFQKYIMDEGSEEIRRAVLCNNTAVAERLAKYVKKSLKEAIQEVCGSSEESILHDFASKLDPVVDELNRLNEDITRIESQKAVVRSELEETLRRNGQELEEWGIDHIQERKRMLRNLHDLQEKREKEFGVKGAAFAMFGGALGINGDRRETGGSSEALNSAATTLNAVTHICGITYCSLNALKGSNVKPTAIGVGVGVAASTIHGATRNYLQFLDGKREHDEGIARAEKEYERHVDMFEHDRTEQNKGKQMADEKARREADEKISNLDKNIEEVTMKKFARKVSFVLRGTFERDKNKLQTIREELLNIISMS